MDTNALIPAKITAAQERMKELEEQDRFAEQRLQQLQTEAQQIAEARNRYGVEHQRKQERIEALQEVLAMLNGEDTPEGAPEGTALAVVPPQESEEASGG